MKLYYKILFIGLAVLLVGFSFVFAFLWSQSSIQTSRANSKVQIVGIWKNQHTILDYRQDGTAKSWHIDGKTVRNTYSHLRYRLLGDELYVYYSAKPNDYIQRLSGAVFGETRDRYQVLKLSNDELQLLDCDSGVTVAFERSDDTRLKVSP